MTFNFNQLFTAFTAFTHKNLFVVAGCIVAFVVIFKFLETGLTEGMETGPPLTAPLDCQSENQKLKLMVKYLTLALKRGDAEKELYRLAQGHAQVYHSPRIDVLDKQIYDFKQMIKKDPQTLNFFKLNLDLIIV